MGGTRQCFVLTVNSGQPIGASATENAEAADAVVPLVAALSFVAALIHIGASVDHFREFALYTPAFALLAAFQVGWAFAIVRRVSRPALLIGAAVNLAIVALWAVSRTVGVPIAPEPWVPEPVGAADLLATVSELAIVFAGVALALSTRRAAARRIVGAMAPVLLAVLLVSVLYGVTGAHGG